MLINVYMKLHEDSFNGFQVIELTRFCDRQSSKGNLFQSKYLKMYILVVGHRLEIIIDHRLASVAAADAIYLL